MRIFLSRNGAPHGPYIESELREMLKHGEAVLTEAAFVEGTEAWSTVSEILGIELPPPAPEPAPTMQAQRAAAQQHEPEPPVAGLTLKKYFVPAAAVVLLAVGAYLVSPFWAIHKLRKAAEAKDAVYITDSVDFPSFRESLKGALSAQMAKEAAASQEDGGFGAMGAAFGAMMVGPLVDALVTPEAVIGLMQGKDLGAVTGGASADSTAAASPSQEEQNDVSTSMRYEGLNRFVVAVEDKDKKAASLVFQRHGFFSWKLSGVRLQGE
jgi:hypothetical protein